MPLPHPERHTGQTNVNILTHTASATHTTNAPAYFYTARSRE